MSEQSVWIRDTDGRYNEVDIPLPAEYNQNQMDGKADLMIELLEKLPHVVTKPIVIQHTQTIDEQFTLTVNEEKKQLHSSNMNTTN